ncbi:MAG TPA: hypothetical protein VIF37_02920 [Methylobacter sp.]|jgi:hypothetical protein
MTTNFAHSYIHHDSIGNFDACKKYQHLVGEVIQRLYEKNLIKGFQMIIIEDGLQEVDELIPQKLVNTKTKGQYPYLFTRIQPNEINNCNIDEVMASYNSIRIS